FMRNSLMPRRRNSLARTMHKHTAKHIRKCAMSIPVAPNGVTRPAVRDEARDLTSLLSIAPEAKARIRILVVDDEHLLREICAQVLRHEGYEVTVCGRGEEALDLVERRAFASR